LIDPPGEVEEPPNPLRLYQHGVWDPAEQYWGEPDGMLERPGIRPHIRAVPGRSHLRVCRFGG
jgi:hypothetical protein